MSANVRTLIDELCHGLGLEPGKPAFERLAGDLSRLASKEKPWSHRYITSVYNGKIAPSKALAAALDAAGPFYDGIGLVASAEPVTVYSHNPESISGALIMEGAKVCPKCGARFVGNVPWRANCPTCNPSR